MHRDLVSAERLVGHRGLLLDEVVRHEGAVFCVPAEANVVIARIPNSVSTDVSVTPTATLSTAEQEPAKRRRKTRPVAGCQAPWRVRSPDSWRIEAAADRLADVLARAWPVTDALTAAAAIAAQRSALEARRAEAAAPAPDSPA